MNIKWSFYSKGCIIHDIATEKDEIRELTTAFLLYVRESFKALFKLGRHKHGNTFNIIFCCIKQKKV